MKIFSIFIPLIFAFVLIIQNFYENRGFYFLKKYLFYLLFFIFFIFIFWPYLWADPIDNFAELFFSVRKDLVDVRTLYFNEYVQNFLLPSAYIINWIFISSPIIQNLLFVLGFLYCLVRIIRRLFKIEKKMIYNDLWRSENERIDFILLFIFIFFFTFFITFNAPFYNGWRLVYFFNFFIIFFAVYFIYLLFNFFKNKKILKKILSFLIVLSITYNFLVLIVHHPFQSIYFNNFLSKKFVNGFEGDYYGISSKHFFNKILKIDKRKKLNIAVASHTPLQRGLEAFSSDIQGKFNIVGQEYNLADYIYKNNVSEVNIKLNNKYNIPRNFSKVYQLNINKTLIYEIYKRN